ncbi:MAG TPA: YkgJ family cysteine cluster protein, partial [Pyrinomonadaceae bacterium]|nr:YkgJ family cysteine cluster protein [Pyrinomonadaceae bacterium]
PDLANTFVMEQLVRITRLPRKAFYQNLLELNEKKKQRTLEPQLPLLKLSKYVSERTVTARDVPVPDCVSCGACCAYLLFVPVSRADSERLNEFVEITLDDSEHQIAIDRVLPRNAESGHCVNLSGTLGEQAGCTIYAERPKVCHDFDAGSDRCHEYRRIYGLEPRLTDTEIEQALGRLEAVEDKERIFEVQFVEAGTVSRYSFTFGDEESETQSESVQLKIFVFLEDEAPREIHTFDPAEETWFESDFLSLSLAEAKQLIESRVI